MNRDHAINDNPYLGKDSVVADSSVRNSEYAIWGSELSPFALKLRALCECAGLPYAWLPAEGGRLQNLRSVVAIERARRARRVLRYPELSDLDEYPAVPFLLETGPSQSWVHYDSSALAGWLDERRSADMAPLFPAEAALRFVAQLIDEAFDEFGLYLVHHKRWVTSAATNDAGRRLAAEFSRFLPMPPGGRRLFAGHFSRRQVRRLPYLFSVAPDRSGPSALPEGLTPP